MSPREYVGHVRRNVLSDDRVHFHYSRLDLAGTHLWDRLYTVEYVADATLPDDSLPLQAPPNHRSVQFESWVSWCVRRFDWAYYARFPAEVVYRLDMRPRRRSATVREAWKLVDHRRRGKADWLQEFFIPQDRFLDFINLARPILAEGSIRLLNTTVRLIHRNEDAFLSYARQDSFSFVVFFEQALDSASVRATETVLERLLDCALTCDGSYYLCYHRVANADRLARAYPRIGAFFAAKRKHDPETLFLNEFYRQYAPAFLTDLERHTHA
jgi:hypothetical protein